MRHSLGGGYGLARTMRRHAAAAFAVALAVVIATVIASAGTTRIARAAPQPRAPRIADGQVTGLVTGTPFEGGRRFRFVTANGVVNAWIPAHYAPRRAGTVVYVHGHDADADRALLEHSLARQFAASGRNALFVVPEAQPDGVEPVRWESLGALLRETERQTGLARPPGALLLIGHSGAFRTLAGWLGYARATHIILLDALYDLDDDFARWASDPDHRLTLVGADTRVRCAALTERLGGVRVPRIPSRWHGLPRAARTARILYLRSQVGHMELVLGNVVLPLLLEGSALPAVSFQLHAQPLRGANETDAPRAG